jgi:hypothetical protein
MHEQLVSPPGPGEELVKPLPQLLNRRVPYDGELELPDRRIAKHLGQGGSVLPGTPQLL